MDGVHPDAAVPPDRVAVLAHGAGSSAGFLARAFPAGRLGVSRCVYVPDHSGSVERVRDLLAAAAEAAGAPVIVGGVSLGGHAAALLAASPDLPPGVVGCVVCLPAWTGKPDAVAAMTGAAAGAVASLGIAGVLAELDPDDWVTAELRAAWQTRSDSDLARELVTAAEQPAPHSRQLRQIRVPVGIVAMASDPLHPASVAVRWAAAIPRSGVQTMGRDDPAADRAVFADRARAALAAAG
jgi:pimeloyl-ACP methyl ester carboxylesterase